MAEKTNKWMLSTVALSGVIIGIAIGLSISQLPLIKGNIAAGNVVQNQLDIPGTKGNQPAEVPPVTDADWKRGADAAKITFIEYSDTECPFCKRFHATMQQLLKLYPNDVSWVYRHYPIDSNHAKARKESEALECAGDTGGNEKFWTYLDRLMEITPANDGLDLAKLPEIAEYAKIDKEKFIRCLESGKFAQKIQTQVNDAQSIGADGTPHTIIITKDGTKYPLKGYVDVTQLSNAIRPLLQ